MRKVTSELINDFKINDLGIDFMGYEDVDNGILTFHHLILPKKECLELPDRGYWYWNGVILREVPHQYLHVIGEKDPEMFLYLTSEMLDEKVKGFIDMENIVAIDEILSSFEREYSGKYSNKGNPIIREEYTRRRIKK